MELSVILPTLNRLDTARLIAFRVRELLPDVTLEVLIVTPKAASSVQLPSFVRLVADAGGGVYPAYAQGLGEAKGEYVWFLGDDDYPLDALRRVVGMLLSHKPDLLVAPVLFSNGKVYGTKRSALLLIFRNWCQQGVIYRRTALLRYRFYRRLRVQADHFVNVLMFADKTLKKQFMSEPICVFGVEGLTSRYRDLRFRMLRPALARRTLTPAMFLAFRLLTCMADAFKKLNLAFR